MFQTQLAREQQIPLSTLQRWSKQYLEKGLAVHVYIRWGKFLRTIWRKSWGACVVRLASEATRM